MARAMNDPPAAISAKEGELPFLVDELGPASVSAGLWNMSWKKLLMLSTISIIVFFAVSTKSNKGEPLGSSPGDLEPVDSSSDFSVDSTELVSSGKVLTRAAPKEKIVNNGHTVHSKH